MRPPELTPWASSELRAKFPALPTGIKARPIKVPRQARAGFVIKGTEKNFLLKSFGSVFPKLDSKY